MANYKGHVLGGLALGSAYAAALTYAPTEHFTQMAGILHDWQLLAAIMVLSVLFALFPDIDTNSKGQNIFFGLALAADIALIWSGNI